VTGTFAVLIPVGPGEAEVDRLQDTVASVRAHESRARLVLIDDSPQPRDLDRVVPDADVVRTALWGDGGRPDAYSAMVAGSVDGLRAASRLEPRFVLKLDTDALVIAPFAEKIAAALDDDPTLGVVGSYDRMCNGGDRGRNFGKYRLPLLRSMLPLQPYLSDGRPRVAWRRDSRRIAALYRRARRSGYVTGAHCLGGSYAVSGRMLAHDGLLDWRPFAGTKLSEDVVVGLICHAAGLRMRSLVDAGEPFGLAHVGLPGSPGWLAGRGHSVIHSVKDADGRTEDEIRQWARELRAA
jgi:hypothetical protein